MEVAAPFTTTGIISICASVSCTLGICPSASCKLSNSFGIASPSSVFTSKGSSPSFSVFTRSSPSWISASSPAGRDGLPWFVSGLCNSLLNSPSSWNLSAAFCVSVFSSGSGIPFNSRKIFINSLPVMVSFSYRCWAILSKMLRFSCSRRTASS